MTSPLADFMESGLRHFHDGYRAVTEFGSQVHRILEEAVLAATPKTLKVDPGRLNDGMDCHVSGGSRIYLRPAAHVEQVDVQFEIGIWWHPSDVRSRLIAYANYAAPDAITRDEFTLISRKALSQVIGGKSRVFIPLERRNEAFRDLDRNLSILINELDRAGAQMLANGLQPHHGRRTRRSGRAG